MAPRISLCSSGVASNQLATRRVGMMRAWPGATGKASQKARTRSPRKKTRSWGGGQKRQGPSVRSVGPTQAGSQEPYLVAVRILHLPGSTTEKAPGTRSPCWAMKSTRSWALVSGEVPDMRMRITPWWASPRL